MKNRKEILIIIGLVLFVCTSFVIFKLNDNNSQSDNKLLDGYYQLEKVISYYNLGKNESSTELEEFYNNKKLHIENGNIESKILETNSYKYLIKNEKIYYSMDLINENELDKLNYFEYDINGDSLVLVARDYITEAYHYKKISKEEY